MNARNLLNIKNLLLGAAISAAALTAITAPASAYVVCNREGDCWRTHERYDYRPAWGITVYNDKWHWADRDRANYRWRDYHRGYWGRNGVWITF